MKGLFALFLVLAVSMLIFFLFFAFDEPSPEAVNENENVNVADTNLTVFTEIKPDHWLASTPENNMTVPNVPPEVIIRFSSPIDHGSTITVKHNNTVVSEGDVKFTQDSQSMYLSIKNSEGSGPYLVTYKACTGKDECQAGRFGFNVR